MGAPCLETAARTTTGNSATASERSLMRHRLPQSGILRHARENQRMELAIFLEHARAQLHQHRARLLDEGRRIALDRAHLEPALGEALIAHADLVALAQELAGQAAQLLIAVREEIGVERAIFHRQV